MVTVPWRNPLLASTCMQLSIMKQQFWRQPRLRNNGRCLYQVFGMWLESSKRQIRALKHFQMLMLDARSPLLCDCLPKKKNVAGMESFEGHWNTWYSVAYIQRLYHPKPLMAQDIEKLIDAQYQILYFPWSPLRVNCFLNLYIANGAPMLIAKFGPVTASHAFVGLWTLQGNHVQKSECPMNKYKENNFFICQFIHLLFWYLLKYGVWS